MKKSKIEVSEYTPEGYPSSKIFRKLAIKYLNMEGRKKSIDRVKEFLKGNW